MKPALPPLAQRQQPGLSETLTGPRSPDRCQSCGGDNELSRWQEHDAWDKPLPIIVVLCRVCSKRLIDPHPRLYKAIRFNQPWPGAMELCVDCPTRDGTACRHPLLKANGGPGLPITIKPPTRAHLNYGGGRGEWVDLYDQPASDCAGLPKPLVDAS